MCLETNGGYFILRKEYVEEDGIRVAKRYIDWVKEPVGGTDQVAQFARNMIDLNQDLNGSDVVTVLIPTGEDDILINNTTVWDDDTHLCPYNEDGFTFLHASKSDELIWKEGYEKYGRILKQKDWNDISDKGILQQRACEWIVEQMKEPVTIECTAADLHYITDKDYMIKDGDEYVPYMPFFLGQKVEVLSQPHGMIGDGPNGGKMLPIYKININLDSGVKRMSIGTPPKRELTDIVKSGSSSTRSTSSGTSSSSSGGGSTVSIPVKDVRVKNAGDTAFKSVVKKKIAKIDLSELSADAVQDVKVNGTSVVNEEKVANISLEIPVTDVQVDSVSIIEDGVANLDSSQFGTTVVANPSGTATDDLTKIQIGTTVYDIAGNLTYSPTIYSEREHEIGVWTDGKPLYQKSFDIGSDVSLNANSWYDTAFKPSDYNMEKVTQIFSVMNSNSNANVWEGFGAVANRTSDKISLLNMRNGAVTIRYFTIQYTKTTDQPGSGTWTPKGAYTHIYSEDETVIGQWTDGKPLYELTIQTSYGPTKNPTDAVVATIPNFSNIRIKNIKGYNRDNNVDCYTAPLNYGHPTTTWATYFWIDVSTGQIKVGAGYNAYIQYTKNTDTTITGQQNSLISKADLYDFNSYSTTEHIVGKWIDGSYIYERTFDLGSNVTVPANSWLTSTIPKGNMNRIISAFGMQEVSAFFPLNAIAYETNIDYVRLMACRTANIAVRYVILQYTKTS